MEKTLAAIDELIRAVGTLAEQPEVQALIEVVRQQQQQIEAQQQQIEKLKDELSKLKHRSSHNSSVPPSQDLLKKTSRKEARKPGKKRGPKYDHPGNTRNGFGQANQIMRLSLETCPVCGRGVTVVEQALTTKLCKSGQPLNTIVMCVYSKAYVMRVAQIYTGFPLGP